MTIKFYEYLDSLLYAITFELFFIHIRGIIAVIGYLLYINIWFLIMFILYICLSYGQLGYIIDSYSITIFSLSLM